MATVTFIKYAKQSAGALGGVAAYVAQANKTMQENGQQLVSGQNCTPPLAVREFLTTRAIHRKESPVWFYHYVQSFAPSERVTGELAHELAKMFAAKAWPESEVLIATSTASTSTRILLSIASATAAAKCFDRGQGRWQGCAPSQMSFARRMDFLSFQDRKQRRKDLGQESTAPPSKVRAGSSSS